MLFSIHCIGGHAGSQVLYNSTSNLWACCSYDGGKPDCSNPTNETFAAPGPASLKTIINLPKTGNITSFTPSSTAKSHSSTSSSSSSSSSPSISRGVAAGIGVGAGFGVVLITILIAFIFIRRRRHARDMVKPYESLSVPQKQHMVDFGSDKQPVTCEMDTNVIRQLDNGKMCHEMP